MKRFSWFLVSARAPHVISLLVGLFWVHTRPESAFAQLPTYGYFTDVDAILMGEVIYDEKHLGTEIFLPFPNPFSVEVNGANASATADNTIVKASASSWDVYSEDIPALPQGVATAKFFDVLKIIAAKPQPGSQLAVSGKIRYSREGFGNGVDGDVGWYFTKLGEPATPGNGGSESTQSGEKTLIVPFGNLDANGAIINPILELSLEASAISGVTYGEPSGGPASASIELVQNHGFFGQFGGDALAVGTWSGPIESPEFTPDQTAFGVSARIVGKTGRVYKRGDTNTVNVGNFLDATLNLGGALWNRRGAGSTTMQQDGSGSFAQMQSGSEEILYQSVDTPLVPMNLRYDVALVPNTNSTNDGTLSVYLDHVLIDQIDSSILELGVFVERNILVDNPALQGLTGVEFAFHWDGPTGAGELVWLDNAVLTPIPEPATWVLLLVGAACMSWRRIRGRKQH